MLTTIIFVLIIFLLIYRHMVRNFDHWKAKNIPYLPPILFFGNIYSVVFKRCSIGAFLQKSYETTQSPYLGLFRFDQPIILHRDPTLLKHFFIKDFDNFIDRGILNPEHDKLGSKMMFLIKGEKWRTLRKKFTPIFTSGKLKHMYPLIDETSDELAKYIQNVCVNKASVNCRHMGVKYGTDSISSCVFGLKTNSLQNPNSPFFKMTEKFFSVDYNRATQMASYVFAPMLAELFRFKFLNPTAANFMQSVFNNVIRERNESGFERGDLIDMIMEIGTTTSGLDGDDLVANAIQFLIAGFETTAATLSFILYELSLNKKVQQRLRDEIQKTAYDRNQFSNESLLKMKYIDMVIKEGLRKYPPLTYLDRVSQNTYQIPGTDVVIEKGTEVYISLMGLQMDERYFPDPEKFDPERFSDENISLIQPFTYMPFGEGLRKCIGLRFGELSIKSALTKILLNFNVEPSHCTPNHLTYEDNGFLLTPKNGVLHVRFTPLEAS